MQIHLELTGRAPGETPLPASLELPEATSLAEGLMAIAEHAPAIPRSCVVFVNGVAQGTVVSPAPIVLQPGDEVLLLAPVAGG